MFRGVGKLFRRKEPVVTGKTSARSFDSNGLRAWLATHSKLKTWATSSTIIVALLTLFAFELRSEYIATLSNAERASQSFADVVAEHTARTFEAVQRTLRIAESIRSAVRAGRITRQTAIQALQTLQKSSPTLISIQWTNEAGDVVAHSDAGNEDRTNIADLPDFIAQRDGKAEGIFIAPLYRSKATKSLISSVSLRLNNADGSFAGIVSATLDPGYFARTYRSVNLARDDVVTVVSNEGYILFREPFSEKIIGRSLKDTSFFRERLPQSPFGTFITKSPIDGRERVFAYRAVSGVPLIILILQDRSEVLARWYDHIKIFGTLIALLTLVVILGTADLSRRTEQLAEKSALLEATLDNMHEGLIVVDQADRVAVCNRRAMELLDLPAGLMNSRPLSKEVVDHQVRLGEYADATEEAEARHRLRALGATAELRERMRPNGSFLEIRTVPLANGGTIRTYKDITSWKNIEQELKDREMRYRILADNSTDMIFQLDLDFVRRYVSPASQEILGYSPEELLGTKPVNMVHPEDADHLYSIYRALANGQARASVTNRIRHRDGRWIWVEAELRLVRDAETNLPGGILGALRDVSARKALEAEAEKARRDAERSAEVQAQFLAAMSHELRTPLNSIVGFADLLLDRADLAPDARRRVGLIQTASETLLTVVNDVLDFSKIEEGKLELVPAKFDLRTLTDAVVAIVRGSADVKNLDLRVSVDPRISNILSGDDQRIRQVLFNLMNNAIKFTQEGHVSLVAELVAEDEETQQLRLSVADTGIGIPQHKLGRLFQRFSQVDGSTSRQYGGSGLGLAISKRLVEMMGGTIGVESFPGKGSTFWFFLNLPKRAQSQADIRPLEGVKPSSVSAHLLLVEDVDVNREIACAILEGIGYSVDAVSDGAYAILSLQSRHYDLVLMDVQMPGMDGLTATRKIRALRASVANIPIVAMTANVLPEQIAATRSAGMNGHVGKPFKRDALRAEIERCLLEAEQPAIGLAYDGPIHATIHEQSLATLTELLGDAKVNLLLEHLRAQLERFTLSDASVESADIAVQAHGLVSSAGMLGFTDVSACCSRFERATLDNVETGVTFDQVREVCVAAMTEISRRFSSDENRVGLERTKPLQASGL